jgi:hypothetical protein
LTINATVEICRKVIHQQRQRRHLRSQRHQQGIVENIHDLPRPIAIEQPCQKSVRGTGEGFGVDHQSQRRHETQLKAHVEQRVGIEERHDHARREQRVGRRIGPAQMIGPQEQNAHDRRAYHRSRSADHDGVYNQPDDNDIEGAPPPHQPHGDGREDANENDDVVATYVNPNRTFPLS